MRAQQGSFFEERSAVCRFAAEMDRRAGELLASRHHGLRRPAAADRLIEEDGARQAIGAGLDQRQIGREQCTLCVEKLEIWRVAGTIAIVGKPKRRGFTTGQRRRWKKAIVTLHAEDSIELFEGQEA